MSEKTKHFQMRVDQEWLDIIDDWRSTQRPMPSRAEAIRVLVGMGIENSVDYERGYIAAGLTAAVGPHTK